MFTIKNAIKNIYRYKNKYILFGILYLVLILIAAISVSIFVKMNQVTNNILREYASVSHLNRGIADMYDLPDRLSKDDYLTLKDIDYIADIRFSKYNFATNFLKKDVSELEVETYIGENIRAVNTTLMSPVFVCGYNMSLLHITSGDFDLESGRMFENDNECVIGKNSRFIPQRLDENTKSYIPYNHDDESWNDLDLGDKIVIKNNDGIYKEYTVVGIQKENPEDDVNTNRRIIYAIFESAEFFDNVAEVEQVGLHAHSLNPFSIDIMTESISMGYEVLVYLESPEDFLTLNNYFMNDNISINDITFSISPFFPDFWSLVSLTRNMESWGMLFMILTGFIIVSVTIISTIILLNSRKYEIAVLRSIGMKRSKIILNYLVENLAFIWGISIVSLIASQFIAPIFTEHVFAGISELVSPEFSEKLMQGKSIVMFLQNAGLVFGGTTVVVMLSLILACINIVRFEPLKIFNKQY